MWIKKNGDKFSHDYKICIREDNEYKGDDGPLCKLCGSYMGEYYSEDVFCGWINPHGWEDYGYNTCPHCDAEYDYIEGHQLLLFSEELELIYKNRRKEVM